MLRSILLLLASIYAVSADHMAIGKEPGFKAVLAQHGFQAVINAELPPLVERITDLDIADLSGSDSGFNWGLKNINLRSLTYGSATVDLNNEFRITLRDIRLRMGLDWTYRLRIWPHIPNGGGSADVTADRVNIDFGLDADVDPKGRPVLTVTRCDINLGELDIKVSGSMFSWLYNILVGLFRGTLRRTIENQLKTQLTTIVEEQANDIISTIDFESELDETAKISWELTSRPAYPEGRFLEFDLEAAIMPIDSEEAPTDVPHHPLAAPLSGRMLDLQMDQFCLNSGFDTYYKAGRLQAIVVDGHLGPDSPIRLNTATFLIPLPTLYLNYPDMPMELGIRSSERPNLDIRGAASHTVTGPAFVDVFAQNPRNGTMDLVFTLAANLTTDWNSRIEDMTLTANVDDFKIALALVSSSIGQFDVSVVQLLVDSAINIALLPSINELLNRGLPLPSIDGMQFVDPVLAFEPGLTHVRTDVNFRANRFDPATGRHIGLAPLDPTQLGYVAPEVTAKSE